MAAVSEHLSEYRHIVCYVVLIAMSDQISSYKTWPGQDLEPLLFVNVCFDSAFLRNCSSLCGS